MAGPETTFWDFDCPAEANYSACSSTCINSCETTCVGYQRPAVVIEVFSDAGCTSRAGNPFFVEQPCVAIASGAALALDQWTGHTYRETVSRSAELLRAAS